LNNVLNKLRNVLKHLLSFYPTALPVGMSDFKPWGDSILNLSRCPNNETTQGALAVMVLHLGPTECNKPKRYFIKAMNMGAAKEIAHAVFQQIKNNQKTRAEVIKEAQERNKNLEASNGLAQDGEVQATSK